MYCSRDFQKLIKTRTCFNNLWYKFNVQVIFQAWAITNKIKSCQPNRPFFTEIAFLKKNCQMATLIFCTYAISRDFIFVFSGSGNSAPTSEYLPDRPIGYGAFGVVWSVTDPRDSKRVALKKLPNVFQSLVSSKRVFRELKMMRFFRHENVLSCLDILQVSIINI